MDSITHLALGAVIGEALAGKKLGRRAMLFGALAQSIPDIDFVAAFWLPMTDNLLAHRGFTHSILFGILVSLLLAFITQRWQAQYKLPLWQWVGFFGIQIFVHLFLDTLNAYGVGLFEPFSQLRISFDTLYVADPFYSFWPGIALLMLLVVKRTSPARKYWIGVGLVVSSAYLFYSFYNKIIIDRDLKETLKSGKITYNRYFTTPTPLNSWLWYAVVENDSGFYISYRSVFDKRPQNDFHFFPRNDSLLRPYRSKKELQQLLTFSQGYYTAEYWSDTLVFNDLRFGQVVGWHDPRERFAFHYFLQYPESNALVVQRGRFAKWNRETTRSLVRRIGGD
jgi:inner membrane protein